MKYARWSLKEEMLKYVKGELYKLIAAKLTKERYKVIVVDFENLIITVAELKIFNNFEAIALIPRMMLYKTKLLPNYQIDYGYEVVEVDIPSCEKNTINIFDIKTVL